MKRQKQTIGAIYELRVDNYFFYTQFLGNACYAFFEYHSTAPIENISVLAKSEVLFIIAIYRDIITKGEWPRVGKLLIRESLQILPDQFIEDTVTPGRFLLYNANTGDISESTREKCMGLERCEVYDSIHVIERLRTYLKGERYTGNDFQS